MRKILKSLSVVSLLALSLIGCSKEEGGEKVAKSKPTRISFTTASTTGTVYPLGSAICNLWNTKLDNVRASAQASNGGVANLNMVADQEAQIGVAVTSILYESYKGVGTFKGRANENLRVLAGLYYNPNQIVVSKDAEINSLNDLVGKSFAPGAAGGTTEVETKLHLTGLGINYPDAIKAQYVGATEAIDLIRNKQIDGVWIMAGIPTSSVTELTSTANSKLLSVDEKLIEKLQVDYPWYSKFKIPAGTYKDQDEDVMTSAIKLTIFTDARVDDEVVYNLTKVFWENFEEVQKVSGALKNVKVEDGVTDLAGVPLHKGSERYYKEVGVIK